MSMPGPICFAIASAQLRMSSARPETVVGIATFMAMDQQSLQLDRDRTALSVGLYRSVSLLWDAFARNEIRPEIHCEVLCNVFVQQHD
jgi:hypothetical protein